jgi:hypothetical protein
LAAERTPAMSVVLVTEGPSECLRWTLERLQAQTIVAELECLLVTRAGAGPALAGMSTGGALAVRVIENENMDHGGSAKAAGVQASRAELVAFVEDHSYPDPGWAEALIRAHAVGRFAAVGPVVLNANPATARSWGCFLVYYGMYMQAPPEGRAAHLAGNHTCYRREVLLDYGPRLADLLESEIALHGELLADGLALRQEPAARIFHLNYSSIAPAVGEYALASRVYAAQRRLRWTTARRGLYAFGSPLLPFIKLPRVVKQARRARLPWRTLAPAACAALPILCAGAIGELLGYSMGLGEAGRLLMRFEREHASLYTAQDLEEVALAGRHPQVRNDEDAEF